jgi:hypothetical protein
MSDLIDRSIHGGRKQNVRARYKRSTSEAIAASNAA